MASGGMKATTTLFGKLWLVLVPHTSIKLTMPGPLGAWALGPGAMSLLSRGRSALRLGARGDLDVSAV